MGRPGAGSGRAGRADQDSKLGDADPQAQPKRFRATPEDEPAAFGSASQDAEQSGQEQLPAKRKRTQLFSVKDIMAVDRTEGGLLVDIQALWEGGLGCAAVRLQPWAVHNRNCCSLHQTI